MTPPDRPTVLHPLAHVFSDPNLARIFSEEAVIENWLEVERALATVQGELGVIPSAAADAISREVTLAKIDRAALWEETATVGYPILPLIAQVSRSCSEDVGRYFHWGATTQDIMDSALAIQLGEALAYIETLVIRLGNELARLAEEHRTTLMVGRTHAQHAVPITLGSKFAVWLSEFGRHLARLRGARSRASTVQLFGAAGTAAALGPASRETRVRLAERLGLSITDVPWQSARDTPAEVAFVAAALSATCGKIAREFIELSRPEIGELQEPEASGRGASSTMPQKRNPITSEAIVAMSVQAIHQVPSLLFAMQGGHERAAGEWQIEWDALPTAISLAGASLVRASEVIGGIQVFPERMRSNAQLEGDLLMAEKIMMALAPTIGRSSAHEAVYKACLDARANGMSLTESLEKSGFSLPATGDMLDPETYLGEVDQVVTIAVAEWSELSAH